MLVGSVFFNSTKIFVCYYYYICIFYLLSNVRKKTYDNNKDVGRKCFFQFYQNICLLLLLYMHILFIVYKVV